MFLRQSLLLSTLLTFAFLHTVVSRSQGLVHERMHMPKAPFLVQFRHGQKGVFCSGTLVTKKFVLTAAHCFDGITDLSDIVVVGGTNSLTEKGTEQRNIAFVTRHPKYDMKDNQMDIAIVKLMTPMKGFNIAPAKLCRQPPKATDFIEVYEWDQSGNDIHSVRLPIEKNESSQPEKNHVFSGVEEKNESFCKERSGGPGIFRDQLCGIVSVPSGCGKPDDGHTIFTDVRALFVK